MSSPHRLRWSAHERLRPSCRRLRRDGRAPRLVIATGHPRLSRPLILHTLAQKPSLRLTRRSILHGSADAVQHLSMFLLVDLRARAHAIFDMNLVIMDLNCVLLRAPIALGCLPLFSLVQTKRRSCLDEPVHKLPHCIACRLLGVRSDNVFSQDPLAKRAVTSGLQVRGRKKASASGNPARARKDRTLHGPFHPRH